MTKLYGHLVRIAHMHISKSGDNWVTGSRQYPKVPHIL